MTSNAAVSEGMMRDDLMVNRVADAEKVSWGSIIAGMVVAVGTWVLLSVLGLALGLSAADPGNPGSLKSAGMITGIWSLVVPIVALLIGGLVAARTAGVVTRPTGAIHGVVLWALATVASLLLVGYVVRGVVGTAVGAGAGLVNAASGAASDVSPSGIGQSLGIKSDDLMAPINEKLRAEGKPPVTSAQMDAVMKDVAGSAVRQGRVDRELITASLARNTKLSQADANDVANRLETQVTQQGNQLGQTVQSGAVKAADSTGHAMWFVFLGLALGLGAAVIGSTLGVSRKQRVAATPTQMPPIVTNRPAHST